jgi:hypothetical protein
VSAKAKRLSTKEVLRMRAPSEGSDWPNVLLHVDLLSVEIVEVEVVDCIYCTVPILTKSEYHAIQ